MELMEELTEPESLSTGARDVGLPLQGPRDEVDAQEHGIAKGGPACVGAANPISVGVNCIQPAQKSKKAIVEGTAEVVKNPLSNSEIKAHLLDHVGNVELGEDEVL